MMGLAVEDSVWVYSTSHTLVWVMAPDVLSSSHRLFFSKLSVIS